MKKFPQGKGQFLETNFGMLNVDDIWLLFGVLKEQIDKYNHVFNK